MNTAMGITLILGIVLIVTTTFLTGCFENDENDDEPVKPSNYDDSTYVAEEKTYELFVTTKISNHLEDEIYIGIVDIECKGETTHKQLYHNGNPGGNITPSHTIDFHGYYTVGQYTSLLTAKIAFFVDGVQEYIEEHTYYTAHTGTTDVEIEVHIGSGDK